MSKVGTTSTGFEYEITDEAMNDAELLDKALYGSPALAISSVRKAMIRVAMAAEHNYHRAHSLIQDYSEGVAKQIYEDEDFIDFMTQNYGEGMLS